MKSQSNQNTNWFPYQQKQNNQEDQNQKQLFSLPVSLKYQDRNIMNRNVQQWKRMYNMNHNNQQHAINNQNDNGNIRPEIQDNQNNNRDQEFIPNLEIQDLSTNTGGSSTRLTQSTRQSNYDPLENLQEYLRMRDHI